MRRASLAGRAHADADRRHGTTVAERDRQLNLEEVARAAAHEVGTRIFGRGALVSALRPRLQRYTARSTHVWPPLTRRPDEQNAGRAGVSELAECES